MITNIKRMTKWGVYSALFTFHFSLFTSCSDFLQIEPQEIIVLDKYWDEEADVNAVVAGCYSAMQSQSVISRMMVWGEFRSDNIVGGKNYENDVQIANIFKENINASNSYAKWGDFYNIINRCNTVLKYAPQVAEKDPSYTQGKLDATIAEVSALRDLMYFYLIRTFRDVPYITEPYLDDNQQMNMPATAFDDILEALIADLEAVQSNAVKQYPKLQTYYQRGRITQDAIHAMLADMYLWKQDYQNAVRYADMVINAKIAEYEDLKKNSMSLDNTNTLIDGFPLINDVYMNGTLSGRTFAEVFGSGNSSESIFELIFMDDETMQSNDAISTFYGNASTYPGLVKPSEFIGTDISDERFNVFLSKDDSRYYENLQPVQGQTNVFGVNKYVTPNTLVNLAKAKLEGSYGIIYADGNCHSNWIVYRLSDIMLIKAEALVEMANDADDATSNELTTAFKIVNAINKRSNCSKGTKDLNQTNYATKALMRELVLEERQRELMFEGKRWYDLVRRSQREGSTNFLIGAVSRKGNSGATSALSSKLARLDAIYWPYHIDELKVNQNLKQNPAFGSGEDSSIERTK